MLTYAAILPHAPVLIPEVDAYKNKKIEETVDGVKKIAHSLNSLQVDTVIFLLPADHLGQDERISIHLDKKARGNMSQFGNWKVQAEISLDSEFSFALLNKLKEEQIPFYRENSVSGIKMLDNETLVPLYYLGGQVLSVRDFEYKYAILHAPKEIKRCQNLGKILKDLIDDTDKKYAVLISGDLAHGHGDGNSAESSQKFDEDFVSLFEKSDFEGIFRWQSRAREVGEDILNQSYILSEILRERTWRGEVLSYQNTFKIGYVAAEIDFW